jgi:hypothetical protein
VASLGRDQSRKQIKANTAEKEQKEREEDKANNWVAIGLQKDHSGIPLLTCPPAHPLRTNAESGIRTLSRALPDLPVFIDMRRRRPLEM